MSPRNISANITSDNGNIGFGSLFDHTTAPEWFTQDVGKYGGAVATSGGGPNVNAQGAITGNVDAKLGSVNQVLAASTMHPQCAAVLCVRAIRPRRYRRAAGQPGGG